MEILVPEERADFHDSGDIFILSKEGDISELECFKVGVAKQDLQQSPLENVRRQQKTGRQLAQGNHKIQRF